MKFNYIIFLIIITTSSDVIAMGCINMLRTPPTKEQLEKTLGHEITENYYKDYRRAFYLPDYSDEQQLTAVIKSINKMIPGAEKLPIREMHDCFGKVIVRFTSHNKNEHSGKYFRVVCVNVSYVDNDYDFNCSKEQKNEIYIGDRAYIVNDNIEITKAIEVVRYLYDIIENNITLLLNSPKNLRFLDKERITNPELLKYSIYSISFNEDDNAYVVLVSWPDGFTGEGIYIKEIFCGESDCYYKVTMVKSWIS